MRRQDTMNSRRAAFIDAGTNTILCLIAELKSDGSFETLDDLAEITRLGEGVDKSGRIGAEGEQRSLQVLRRYGKRCRELGVQDIIAVGTSALREAQNSAAVRARFREELGFDIRVISGDEEAAYSFLAVQKGTPVAGQELLVIDVGGGSTELIRGNQAGISEAVSIDVGSVRLTEQFLYSDPVRKEECAEMLAAIDRAFMPWRRRWSKSAATLVLVGIAGTFTTLAAVEKRLMRYSHSEVHGSILTLKEIQRQVELFRGKTIAERMALPGLEPGRADVILAGACLVERIMACLDAERIIVSDQGVRYGLLHERLINPL
jgi:exopolyphosphatase/guanosine-5'-triphosphate,3'-diphosphate pyrophosphatase